MATIYPSLISADLLNLQAQLEALDPYCHGYHLDVMDAHFVPNLTWGPAFINAISRSTYKKIWVHLMVEHPLTLLETLTLNPGSMVSFHIESQEEKTKLIKRIKEKQLEASIAISPKTPVDSIFPYLNSIEQVLIMSVEPGFSGQQFLPEVMHKVAQLVAYRSSSRLKFRIGIDGGVNEENIQMIAQSGVDDIACAHAIFGHADPVERLQHLQELISHF